MYSTPDFIRLPVGSLPREEQEFAHFIEENLRAMKSAVTQFDHVLSLFLFASQSIAEIGSAVPARPLLAGADIQAIHEHVAASKAWRAAYDQAQQSGRVFESWRRVAARESVMIAHGFLDGMEAIISLLSNCPTLQQQVDFSAKERGEQVFASAFPDIAAIRIQVAHHADLPSTPKKIAKHIVSEEAEGGGIRIYGGASGFVGGSLNIFDGGCRITSTVRKKLVSSELSATTRDALASAAGEFFAAFGLIAKPLADAT